MTEIKRAKILKFNSEKCVGCLECEKACSQVHFKCDDGGEKSAIRIHEKDGSFQMHVCNQNGLCIDMCPVGAIERMPNGTVILNKNICVGCQACVAFCPLGAMKRSASRIEPFKCISCGACVRACPEDALELVEVDIEEIKQIVFNNYGGANHG